MIPGGGGAQPPPDPPPPPSTSAPGCPHRYSVVSSTVTETMSFVPYAPDQMFCPVCLSTGIGRLNGKNWPNSASLPIALLIRPVYQ